MRVLVIDNYDSFTYNLVQYLGELGAEVRVRRNDEVTATTDDGVVMGLRHRDLAVEGVQFHPESVLTAAGHLLLRNFLDTT